MSEEIRTENLLLDAVNILLESINELPIEDVEDFDVVLEARQARSKIYEVTRAVLSEEWDFNRDTDWVFPLDISGRIPVPQNVLDITAERHDVIMRDWLLYSKSDHSFVFKEEVKCDVVWLLDFDSLTHPMRHYITIRACRIFASRTIGDQKAIAFNSQDEEDAYISALRSDGRTGGYNILNSGYGINSNARIG